VAPAVISEIDLIRGEARQRIHRKRVCSTAVYPAAEAVNDALNYHEMCSFVVGLTSLLRKAGVEQRVGDPAASAVRRNVSTALASAKADEASLEAEVLAATKDKNKELVARLERSLDEKRLHRRDVERIQLLLGPADEAQTKHRVSLDAQLRLLDQAVSATNDALALATDTKAKSNLKARLTDLAAARSALIGSYALEQGSAISDQINECYPKDDAPVPLPN